MKVFIDNAMFDLDEKNKNKLEQLGYEIQSQPDVKTEVLVSTNRKVINNINEYPNIRFLQLTSAGYDFLDFTQARQQEVLVSNARGVYSEAIAEFVVARLLQVNQQLRRLDHDQDIRHWNRQVRLNSLINQKGAILGTGSIGKECAKRLKVFGPVLDGYNTKGTTHEEFDQSYPLSEFDLRASEYDFIVITLPLNSDTKHFFNKQRLLSLNKEGILINIARGPIIEENDLGEILDDHLQAVILDVFETEPLSPESSLWNHQKAYLSAHISFKNNYYVENIQNLVVDNLERFINHQELINVLEY